ncbi:hypothetical protein O1L60_01385 [Streptomyces diastatochromogenes]|nr:hypothetical protein [Streptomyces diastatochromogenes]
MNLDDRIVEYARQAGKRAPYTPPGDSQRERLARGVGHLLDGERGEAEKQLAAVGFRVTRLTDSVSGRRYDEVAALKPGTEERWRRLYVNADAAVRWSVQVPHPVADRGTESLGARLLEDAPGGASSSPAPTAPPAGETRRTSPTAPTASSTRSSRSCRNAASRAFSCTASPRPRTAPTTRSSPPAPPGPHPRRPRPWRPAWRRAASASAGAGPTGAPWREP